MIAALFELILHLVKHEIIFFLLLFLDDLHLSFLVFVPPEALFLMLGQDSLIVDKVERIQRFYFFSDEFVFGFEISDVIID